MLENIIYILQNYGMVFWNGFYYTILYALITVIIGTIIGAILAICQISKYKVLNAIVVAYIEVIRDTPTLMQIYFFWIIVPRLFPGITDTQSVLMALIAGMSAYTAEIIRAGIEAIDTGQTEAAESLGMSGTNTMLYIILPQAIKNILPALCNEFITAIKSTSLASIFFLGELMTAYKSVQASTFLVIEPLLIIGVIYFVVNFILSKLVKKLERRMHSNER